MIKIYLVELELFVKKLLEVKRSPPDNFFSNFLYECEITNCFCIQIKGFFEATTILHDEVHASVQAEKMKIFWLCCKNKFPGSPRLPGLTMFPRKFST